MRKYLKEISLRPSSSCQSQGVSIHPAHVNKLTLTSSFRESLNIFLHKCFFVRNVSGNKFAVHGYVLEGSILKPWDSDSSLPSTYLRTRLIWKRKNAYRSSLPLGEFSECASRTAAMWCHFPSSIRVWRKDTSENAS